MHFVLQKGLQMKRILVKRSGTRLESWQPDLHQSDFRSAFEDEQLGLWLNSKASGSMVITNSGLLKCFNCVNVLQQQAVLIPRSFLQVMAPEEVSSMVLTKMKETAENYLGKDAGVLWWFCYWHPTFSSFSDSFGTDDCRYYSKMILYSYVFIACDFWLDMALLYYSNANKPWSCKTMVFWMLNFGCLLGNEVRPNCFARTPVVVSGGQACGRHRARLLQRCSASVHQGRRNHLGHERLAHHQRAHSGSHCLWFGQEDGQHKGNTWSKTLGCHSTINYCWPTYLWWYFWDWVVDVVWGQ